MVPEAFSREVHDGVLREIGVGVGCGGRVVRGARVGDAGGGGAVVFA